MKKLLILFLFLVSCADFPCSESNIRSVKIIHANQYRNGIMLETDTCLVSFTCYRMDYEECMYNIGKKKVTCGLLGVSSLVSSFCNIDFVESTESDYYNGLMVCK